MGIFDLLLGPSKESQLQKLEEYIYKHYPDLKERLHTLMEAAKKNSMLKSLPQTLQDSYNSLESTWENYQTLVERYKYSSMDLRLQIANDFVEYLNAYRGKILESEIGVFNFENDNSGIVIAEVERRFKKLLLQA